VDDTVKWADHLVIKSVYAAKDGVDEQRFPHNIVLEAKILSGAIHPNVRCARSRGR